MIYAKRITEILMDCLMRNDEMGPDGLPKVEYVSADGIPLEVEN